MQTRSRWATFAIISATVAIVFAPVFIPREVARWYLAAAANAYRLGDSAAAASNLERAVAWDAEISHDGDYWIAQLSNTHWASVGERLDLLEKAVQADPRWASEGVDMALLLSEEFDFQNAIRAFKIALRGEPPRSTEGLNLLAYYRALAGIELDEALKDIDRALEMEGVNPAMLDTKAWVLHALRRDLEALPIINNAIKLMEELSEAKSFKQRDPARALHESSSTGELTIDANGSVQTESSDPTSMWPDLTDVRDRIDATKQKLPPAIFSLAVMRFHRMRIYEAVGASPEARLDREWLRQHDVPIVDQLF